MKADNFYARGRAHIFNLYQGNDHLTQQRAWYLYLFCLFLVTMVIQNNAASAEETAAVVGELSGMSHKIESFVRKLDQLVKT